MGDDAEYYMELQEQERRYKQMLKDATADETETRERAYLEKLKLTDPKEYERKMRLFFRNSK